MTPNEFRQLALTLPEAIESAHMHHPDFRVGGRIFATLGYPNKNSAVVKLTPGEQKNFVRKNPEVFKAVKGAWGRQGSTNVYLPAATTDVVNQAHCSMAQHRSETVIEKSLAQTDRFADALHHVIGNFVCAFCATGKNIVDIRLVL